MEVAREMQSLGFDDRLRHMLLLLLLQRKLESAVCDLQRQNDKHKERITALSNKVRTVHSMRGHVACSGCCVRAVVPQTVAGMHACMLRAGARCTDAGAILLLRAALARLAWQHNWASRAAGAGLQ